jgi:hypothetical protein
MAREGLSGRDASSGGLKDDNRPILHSARADGKLRDRHKEEAMGQSEERVAGRKWGEQTGQILQGLEDGMEEVVSIMRVAGSCSCC